MGCSQVDRDGLNYVTELISSPSMDIFLRFHRYKIRIISPCINNANIAKSIKTPNIPIPAIINKTIQRRSNRIVDMGTFDNKIRQNR